MLADTLGLISQAQAELNAELDARREQLNQEIRDAEITFADTQRELASAVDAEQQLAASVAELEAELTRITPSRVLAEFVGKRFASDDYRRHLGVPALVRQDLERLSRLIQQHHDTPTISDEHAIDRVVLYIDDLGYGPSMRTPAGRWCAACWRPTWPARPRRPVPARAQPPRPTFPTPICRSSPGWWNPSASPTRPSCRGCRPRS